MLVYLFPSDPRVFILCIFTELRTLSFFSIYLLVLSSCLLWLVICMLRYRRLKQFNFCTILDLFNISKMSSWKLVLSLTLNGLLMPCLVLYQCRILPSRYVACWCHVLYCIGAEYSHQGMSFVGAMSCIVSVQNTPIKGFFNSIVD
jgi:hypothetical protein